MQVTLYVQRVHQLACHFKHLNKRPVSTLSPLFTAKLQQFVGNLIAGFIMF